MFTESPRRVLLGNPYSPSRIPTRDRQKHGWLNIQLVSRSRTATPEGPQLGSPRCRVIVGPRSYCIGAFPAAVAFVPPLSLLPAKVLWYSSDSRLRSWDTPSLKSCAYSPGCLAGFFSEPVFIRPLALRYRGVGKRACSASFLEDWNSGKLKQACSPLQDVGGMRE